MVHEVAIIYHGNPLNPNGSFHQAKNLKSHLVSTLGFSESDIFLSESGQSSETSYDIYYSKRIVFVANRNFAEINDNLRDEFKIIRNRVSHLRVFLNENGMKSEQKTMIESRLFAFLLESNDLFMDMRIRCQDFFDCSISIGDRDGSIDSTACERFLSDRVHELWTEYWRLQENQDSKHILFGEFMQNDTEKKGIEWTKLQENAHSILYVSKHALFSLPFSEHSDCMYERSDVRNWLISHFLPEAFSETEMDMLLPNTACFNDPVFLLSLAEYNSLFVSPSNRKTTATQYALQSGILSDPGTSNCWQWTRTKDIRDNASRIYYVRRNGTTGGTNSPSSPGGAIRPAILLRKQNG